MYRWQEHVLLVIRGAFWSGIEGAVAGGMWTGALGFGVSIGALWGGIGLAVVGALAGFILGIFATFREGAFYMKIVFEFPLLGVAIIGGIVWLVRALL